MCPPSSTFPPFINIIIRTTTTIDASFIRFLHPFNGESFGYLTEELIGLTTHAILIREDELEDPLKIREQVLPAPTAASAAMPFVNEMICNDIPPAYTGTTICPFSFTPACFCRIITFSSFPYSRPPSLPPYSQP